MFPSQSHGADGQRPLVRNAETTCRSRQFSTVREAPQQKQFNFQQLKDLAERPQLAPFKERK